MARFAMEPPAFPRTLPDRPQRGNPSACFFAAPSGAGSSAGVDPNLLQEGNASLWANARCQLDPVAQPPSKGDARRSALSAERRRFASRRACLAALGGWVGRRGGGGVAARRISCSKRARASSRLLCWLRNRLALMTMTPPRVNRRPARRSRRARTGSGSEGERRASKRSSTAVDTLLTFCPPGPEARTNDSSISPGSRAISLVMRSNRGSPRACGRHFRAIRRPCQELGSQRQRHAARGTQDTA